MPGHHLVVLNDAPKYTVVEANDSMLELIGMTREYLIERSLWDIYPGSSSTMSQAGSKRLRRSIENCVRDKRSGKVGAIRYDMPRSDGSFERRLWAMSNSPIIVHGAVQAVVLTADDVTKQYDDEALTKAHIKHLTEVNRAQDEFISIASHQLRTPATGVKQYLGMLRDGLFGEIDQDQRDIIDRAYESNERQLRIVADLLKVAQIDSGKLSLHKEPTDINQLVHYVIRDNLAMFKKRDQMLMFTPSAQHITVSIDGGIVRTVIENLLDNASKYTEEGGQIFVRVSAQKEAISLQIIDEGVGVPADKHMDLFRKFSRIDNTLSTKVGGTGLGLYWAQQSITAHGGTIRYHANSPRGSIFEVLLPKSQ